MSPREKDEPEFFLPPDWAAKQRAEREAMWDDIENEDLSEYEAACDDAGIKPYGSIE